MEIIFVILVGKGEHKIQVCVGPVIELSMQGGRTMAWEEASNGVLFLRDEHWVQR